MKKAIYSALMLSALALTACSDDNYVGDPAKDWSATIEMFSPAEENGYSTYYKPSIGRVGDPMPFYDQKAKEFKILYLQEYDVNPACYHPFYGVTTTDGVNYQSLGEVLPTGKSTLEEDAALGTGCCVYNEADNLYYIYYTGHTDHEVVLRATSSDFKTWTKDYAWSLRPEKYDLATGDFRDPQIFRDGDVWRMVILARHGDPRFAEFESKDMKNWEYKGYFNCVWDRVCECPDIFKMGDYWYLVYSEAFLADWSRKVKYMMADSFEGLKRCFSDPGANWPKDDREGVLETRAFYAGKTASDGVNRYIWGWCPFRSGATNDEKNVNVGAGGEPNWSGALVCHRLVQHADGTLYTAEVPAMAAKYNKEAEVKVMASENYNNGKISGDGHVLYNRLGYHNHISFTVETAGDGDCWGVSFARGTVTKVIDKKPVTQEVAKYYTLRVNPEWENGRRKVNFEQNGREGRGFIPGADGYIFPRPADNKYDVDIYTDNSVVVMYINGEYSVTNRIYGLQKNSWSINSYGGNITVSNVKVSQY